MESEIETSYVVGILVVSDSVSKGEKDDRSGIYLEQIIRSGKYFAVTNVIRHCVPDDRKGIEDVIKNWADQMAVDLILTVGGTGFSPRDVTPEATKSVIEREAPHIASYMIIKCSEATQFAVLSRSVCGIRGRSLILNLPGSTKGAQECFEMVSTVLSHAIDQLKENNERIVADHVKIQGSVDDRTRVKTE